MHMVDGVRRNHRHSEDIRAGKVEERSGDWEEKGRKAGIRGIGRKHWALSDVWLKTVWM